MNSYIIRKLNISDYEKYLNLITQFQATNFTLQEYTNTLNIIERNSTIWVIDYKDELIGTATIFYEYKFIHNIAKSAHIEDVCIDKNYRNKGIGNLLINFLVNEANKEKCYKIILDCDSTLEKFYNKSGLEKKNIQMAKYF
jgi:glucosamine-phosphate N-acetyltransferase